MDQVRNDDDPWGTLIRLGICHQVSAFVITDGPQVRSLLPKERLDALRGCAGRLAEFRKFYEQVAQDASLVNDPQALQAVDWARSESQRIAEVLSASPILRRQQ